jgi:predicted anti-sigma-YlaC factor YlaD
LARLLGDLLGRDAEAMELRVDNKSALALAKNHVFHERSKHIRIKYHFIRSCLDEESIKAGYINTQDQLADLLTKSLGRVKFQELRARIGMVQFPRRRHTRLKGRMTAISLVIIYLKYLSRVVGGYVIYLGYLSRVVSGYVSLIFILSCFSI